MSTSNKPINDNPGNSAALDTKAPAWYRLSAEASGHSAQSEGKKQLLEPLTNREAEILKLLPKRYSNKEIAAELVISPATVKLISIRSYLSITGAMLFRRRGTWA